MQSDQSHDRQTDRPTDRHTHTHTHALSLSLTLMSLFGCKNSKPRIATHMQEPTSGLDSALASRMVQTLRSFSTDNNKTVVSTIHQPSSHVFHMFDQVLLIGDGQVLISFCIFPIPLAHKNCDNCCSVTHTRTKNFNPFVAWHSALSLFREEGTVVSTSSTKSIHAVPPPPPTGRSHTEGPPGTSCSTSPPSGYTAPRATTPQTSSVREAQGGDIWL